jgi:hypothetical protein
MKTRYSFFSILFWIPMIVWGQQIETHVNSGLQVIKIKTIQGTVTVNLPEQIHAGDVISGSVIAEANVQTDSKLSKKKQRENAQVLEQFNAQTINIFGQIITPKDQFFSINIPLDINPEKANCFVKDHDNQALACSFLNISKEPRVNPTNQTLSLPTYFRSGYYERVSGLFDGNAQNTGVFMNESPLHIVAESPACMIISIPENLHGTSELQIFEKDWGFDESVQIINLIMEVGKTDLKKGESTNMQVSILGVDNLTQPLQAHIENLSPTQIELNGGNLQTLEITDALTSNGLYHNTYTITALLPGGYTILGEVNEAPYVNFDYGADTDSYANAMLPETDIDMDISDTDTKKNEVCPLRKYTDWKKIGTTKALDESQKQYEKTTQRRCYICEKSVTYTYYRIPEYLYDIEERTYIKCTLQKGHDGGCHGTEHKETRKVKKGEIIRYKRVMVGDCGHKIDMGWKSK